MHFSCEDIFKNQRFQYIGWGETNNVVPFRLNSSYWAPFTPTFSHQPGIVNIHVLRRVSRPGKTSYFLKTFLSLVKMVNGFQHLFTSFVLLRHKWLYDSNSDQESICFYFFFLYFRYPSMSDNSLPEEIPTTLDLTEMALIIIVCGYQSL